ncbi:fatty acyl-AMP ligase [Streptomonospora nanhaiensis]|uniref:Acyl-CoA synthetase (AMP-forming)/AMP-acid ligase II n=1 Tax=Streptomonospora nanhaiensis TaxID=1323731 RepID=A0A853BIK8_9ACTN|nr:fatty acyl-AMP ligase [Streptomonospora nanhaiensis]MBV2362909.1 fatty acyl-AMP ligase [Streptomonospora nanhaiensis]NYI95269.1 acyl-CoA synthetase (AMP-forming)/AMP-acid ligase II [Streptomonospora nanhaiensis]
MKVVPKASTLAESLSAQARERGSATVYRFLPDGENEKRALTFAELDLEVRAIAAHIQRAVAPGERALVLTSESADFIRAFLACQYAGVIAVPVYPPLPLNSLRKTETLRAIARDAGVAAVLSSSTVGYRAHFATAAPELAAAAWIAVDAVPDHDAADYRPHRARPADVAFLQYTSGSTALPKGVVVTNEALMHNQEYIRRAGDYTPETVIVSWLPLFHDMGLIGTVLPAVYVGLEAVLMPPLAFVQRPVRWLRAISRYRATVAGGPNSGYDLCVRRVRPEDREGLDLSGWRIAFNGAEPVRAATLESFTAEFAPQGFDGRAFYPCYGLAENTLMVTGSRIADPPVTLAVDLAVLQSERRLALGGGHRLVGSGRPLEGRRLAIVDPETHLEAAPGTVGEIWSAGPDVAAGYWNNPEETERAFRAHLADTGEGPFLRTGDLGVLHEGELFVCGRLKDVVIVEGRNHYPQDIEATVEAAHPAVRVNCVAAFAVERDDAEHLVVVAEIDPAHRTVDLAEVDRAVRAAVAGAHSVPVGEVAFVAPGAVPKTTSGKVQRRACRAAFEQGALTPARGTSAQGSRQFEGAK